LASIQNPSKFSRFTPKGTPKFIGVRLVDLWAKVMMAPEPVRPSLVQGVEPLQPSVAELVSTIKALRKTAEPARRIRASSAAASKAQSSVAGRSRYAQRECGRNRRIDRIASAQKHLRAGRRGQRMVGHDHAA
jgi:hypothetical protein